MMVNFLEELKENLKSVNKSLEDIEFITDGKNDIEKNSFIKFASTFNYSPDEWGKAIEIPTNLKIVGSDWWMERHEYDSKEWWEFKTKPIKPTITKEMCGINNSGVKPEIKYKD